MESNQSNNTANEDIIAELLTLTCKVDQFGIKRYFNKEGWTHRIHGPAIIGTDGTEWWYKNGDLHREDGPAIEWSDGDNWYYLHGQSYSKSGFIQWQKDNGIE